MSPEKPDKMELGTFEYAGQVFEPDFLGQIGMKIVNGLVYPRKLQSLASAFTVNRGTSRVP